MASATWDEIKRLAADFQRVQLVETSLKLSERNCIELINKLIELDMLKVIHSIDGKEYITDKQLERDIYDELYVHEGRINQCDLQTLLNIDLSHIEKKVTEIVQNDMNLTIILGQIISKDYMNKVAEEINELLQEKCRVTISELTNLYDLPTSFILQIVQPRVGSIIKGNFDGNILYTLNFVNIQKSLLAGALEACIKPVRIAQIVKEYNLESGMVFETFDSLISSGQIKGTLYGGKQEMSAVFVPEIYTKAQEQYVKSFFKQNGYIEYSNLKKIGITEPDSYVKNLFANQEIEYLSSSCFADYYIHQIGDDIENSINQEGYCDLSQILPSILNEKDLNKLTSIYSAKLKSSVETVTLSDTYLFSKAFLKKVGLKFQEKMEKKSIDDLKEPSVVLAFRSERAIIAGSSQVASKPTEKKKSKGKKNQGNNDQNNDNLLEISFIERKKLEKELESMIADINDHILEDLVEHYLRPLNQQYFELLKGKIESGLIQSAESGSPTSPSKKKISIKEIQENIKLFLINAKIFEKGLKSFSDAKTQEILSKHLIKTIYTDIFNDMVKFIAKEQMITYKEDNFSNDTRLKVIQKFKDPVKQGFNGVHVSLANKPSGEIIELIEKCAIDYLELSMKKQDQKREKEILLQLRENIKASLEKETDPAAILQQVCILMYYYSTGFMLNFPGRLVPTVLEAIKAEIDSEHYSKLIKFQDLIIENLSKSKDDEDEEKSVSTEIIKISEEIKKIGLDVKGILKKEKS